MRARADWDDDWFYTPALQMGVVHDLAVSKPRGKLAAILVLPDPEERHGWREHFVSHDPPDDPLEPMGFKPNRTPE